MSADRLGLDLSDRKRALLDRLLAEEGLDREAPEPIPRRDGSDPPPLSFAQERLWFLDSLAPGSAAYNMPFALALDGRLEVGALRRGLAEIVRRHEVLRTTFVERDRRPVQVISPPEAGPALPVADLSALADAGESACRRLLEHAAARPFDLTRGPLLRALLVRLAPERHVLFLNLHHAVADGASVAVLVAETSALYEAFAAGRRSPLPKLPVQYADYAAWQRRTLTGDPVERLVAWWRERLAGAPPVIDLPLDRPRPRERSGRGGRRRIALDAGLGEALRALGRRRRATLFMTLLAGFGALLARLTHEGRVVIGSPVENRERPELRDLVGFFTNTLPLPVDVTGIPSFETLLDRVRELALGAFAHQELPFARMVEALQPERSLSHGPLFQVLFALQPAAEGLRRPLPGLVLRPLDTALGSAKFDLSLLLVADGDGLSGSLEYDRDLLDATTAQRWVRHLRALVEAAVERPADPVATLPLLSAAERQQAGREWSDAPRPRPAAAPVHRLVAAAAAERPDAVAVRRGSEHVSYRALRAETRAWTARLAAAGVRPGVPVGVLLERRPPLVAALLGILEAGGSYLPLDPAYPAESLAFRLEDSGTHVLVTDAASRGAVPPLPGLTILVAGEPAAREPGGELAIPAGRPADPDSVAYTIYTSGSTGRPKGVEITHRSFAELVRWGRSAFTARELSGVLAATSVTFDLSVFELFVPLAAGGGVVLAADALELAELGPGARVTLVNTVPSVLAEVLRAGALPPAVETVNLAGEPWPPDLAGVVRPAVNRLLNLYGPSEDTTYSTLHSLPSGAAGAPPIGRPVPETRAWLVDPELAPVPLGVAGELCLGGAGLARGYLRRPALTAERFVPDPWATAPGARLYRTGDLARHSTRGDLLYLGRLDHQVKVRGYRIEPGEVEAALGRHPAVERAVVVARGVGTGKARLVAYLLPAEGETAPDLLGVRRFLADTLPPHMVPSAVVPLAELPLTATGKVDRRRLPAPPAEGPGGPARAATARAPRGPVEEAVAEVWREVLERREVAAGDDFFAVGGHSLAAAGVVSRLRRLFGVELPVRAVFETPVLADLAARLQDLRAAGSAGLPAAPPLEAISGGGAEAPLSFAQERLWFLHLLDPANPAYDLAVAVRLAGDLDPGRLERALAAVEARHEPLRTGFADGPEGPVQVIRPPGPAPLSRVDLSALPAPREGVRELVREAIRRPFDLAAGSPWRATLMCLAPREHLLLVEMHHAVSDGWSLGVLVRDVAAFYRGEPPEPLPVRYADFARWQREWLRGERLDALVDSWRRRLAGEGAGAPPELELGADRPRPRSERHRAGRVAIRLDAERTHALRRLSREGGATLFMALLAAFQALLGHRAGAWSGGPRRIPVGTPVANRDRVEVEGLVGLFVNTLVLSTDVGGDPSFRELLGRARETALAAYEHRDLPFAALVEALQPERSLGRTPLFQALLVLQNAPMPRLALPGLEIAAEEVEPAAAKVDLALGLREEGEELAGAFEYSRELFDRTTVARLRGQLLRLLAAVTADPDAPVAALPLLSPAERHRVVHEGVAAPARRTAAAVPKPVPAAAVTPPRTSDERLIAEVWREVLGGPTPALESDFFAAGGHSLLAVRLVTRLRARGVELPLRAVFEAPTLGGLARLLAAGPGPGEAAAAPAEAIVPAAGPDGAPYPHLSANQERLWFLDRLEPGSAAFHLPLALELEGALDAGALARAVGDVVRRHATLRTTFPEVDGSPVRRVAPAGEGTALPRADLRSLPAAAAEAEARRLVRRTARHPFDLAAEPGFRCLLVRLGEARHAFVATLHHLVADGWSLGLFRRELAAFYARHSGDRTVPAPPALPVSFADYSAWERGRLATPEAEAALDAWAERLRGAPTRLGLPLDLPRDRPRPASQSFTRERVARRLAPELVADLEGLGRRQSATLFMVLLSAFEIVLARWSGDRDFLVGTPVAHRNRVELEGLIGLLVNTLVLRATVAGGTFADHLAGRRAEVLEAFARPELPFARLVDKLRPERGLDRAPLVQVMFNLLRFPADAFEARPAGLAMRSFPLGAPSTDLDLLLTAEPAGDGALTLDLLYDPALFDRSRAEELVAQLEGVLIQVAADAELPLGRISLVTPAARRRLPDLHARLPAGDGTGPEPEPVPGRLAALAREAPHRPAVLAEDGVEISYGSLLARAAALARRLLAAGVGRGDRVAVRAARSPALVEALAGILRASAAFVVLDPAHPPARHLEVLRAARPRAWLDLAPEPPADELAAFLDGAGLAFRARLPGPAETGGDPAADPDVAVDPDDLAYVAFTSGSTGRPRGITGSHGPLSRFFDWYARTFRLGPGDRVSLLSGLAHDPLLRDLFATLWAGAAVAVPGRADFGDDATPGALQRWLRRRRITVVHLTPATARLLDPAGQPLPDLRLAVFGGDLLLAGDVVRLRALAPAATVVNGYGATETPQLAACHVLAPGAPAPDGLSVPVGRGVDGAQLWVAPLAAPSGGPPAELAGIGELGEVWVRSRSLARGYLDPRETAERFLAHPFAPGAGERVYRTGDLGRYLPDGTVRHHGRRDRQVSIRGYRVEPAEIERHLAAHPDVLAAAVAARPGPDGVPALAAWAVPRPERAPTLGGRPRRRLGDGLAVVELNRGETDYLYREIFELQAYLRHGLAIDDGDVVLDVGANVGLFLLFAHRVARSPRVFCFEPNPEVLGVLEANARLCPGETRIFSHGLAESERTAEFTFFEGMSLLSGLHADARAERELVRSFLAERASRGESEYGEVLRHADDLLAERLTPRRFPVRLRPLSAVIAELGLERVDYLKINVEKSELDVVAGISSEDWRKVRQVAIEIDVRDHLEPIRERLEREGFETAVVQDELLAGSELYYLYAARPELCPAWRRSEEPGSHLRPLPPAPAPDQPPDQAPAPLEERELLDHLGKRLPAYLVPASVALVERLPLTPSGKLDLEALLEGPAGRRPDRGAAGGPAAATPTEVELAAIWGELLGTADVGAGHDFFASGGHSLLATRLLAQVRDAFGVELPLRQLFETPTLAGLAAVVDARRGEAPPADLLSELPALVPAPAERHEPFPLTPIQQAYWLGRGGAFELGNVSTHLYMELEAPEEALDVARFEAAWQRLIDRHEMLRAVVDPDGRQRIVPDPPPYRIATEDLSALATEAAGERLAEVRRAMSHQVLPAERWPLFDLRASRLAGGRTRLHVSFDFLIADAWSIRILLDELYRLYARPDAELVPIGCSFRDYVLAEARLAETDLHRRSLEYWRRRAPELPPGPALPLARTPTAMGRPRFVRRQASLPPPAWRRLQERAREAGLTPSGVLLAAFAETLAAWSESPHFTLTLTLFHRLPLHPEVDRLVGDFTSVVLLEISPPAAAAEPFAERAGRWQRQLWSDLDHRYVSGVEVVRQVARERGGFAGVVAPVVFTSTLGLGSGAGDGAAASERADPIERAAPVDAPGEMVFSITQTPQVLLDHQVMEHHGALLFNWDAVDALFPPGLLDDVFTSYRRLLERLTEGEEAWNEPAPLPLPEALGELVAEVNATRVPLPETLHLHLLVLEQAARTPAAPAVISFGGGRRVELSYGELVRRAAAVGGELRRRGVQPNELVAVVAEKGWEQVVAVLAVQIAGAAYLPVDPGQPETRRALLLEQGRVRVAVTQPRLDAELAWPEGVERLTVSPAPVSEEPPADLLAPVQAPTDLAYVIFTSGSSGTPKGVMIEHRSAVNTVVDVNRRLAAGPADRVLALSALNFDLSVYDLFGLLAAGGAVVLPEPEAARNPARWSEIVESEGVTVWNSVPTLMSMWVGHQEARPEPAGAGLRAVMMSGDWIPVDLPARIRRLLPEVAIWSLGGATEASIWSILYPIYPGGEVGEDWQSIPYGRPMDNQTFQVLDPALRARRLWVPGELYIGGIGVARGYWRDEERTAASFLRHPETGERLYRTGDLGRWLPGGDIEFLGRRDFQVKVQGHRIELGEIEATLARQPGVRAAVVDAVGERMGSKTLVAYVVPEVATSAPAGPSATAGPPPPLRPPSPLPEAGRLLDPARQLEHKLAQPGLRHDLLAAEEAAVPLPEHLPGPADRAPRLARRSERSFRAAPVPVAALADLLATLRQHGVEGRPLPKYRYPSAGSLYPVQVYLDVRAGRVEGLVGGLYYHDPRRHRLVRLSDRSTDDPAIHAAVNRDLFRACAFAVYLVADLAAIEPLYGDSARDFCLVEAGAICQLLMDHAAGGAVGLCPVGGMSFDGIAPRLGLGRRHAYLLALLGGAAEAALVALETPAPTTASEAASAPDPELAGTLRAALSRTLADYMVPSHFVLLDALPLSANGKVDRSALPLPPGLAGGAAGGYVAPRDELETTIAGAWERVLGRERVGVEDNFFDLGGTSVEIIQLHGELVRATGREVSLVELFNFPTVGAMARYLSRRAGDTEDDALESSRRRARERRQRRRRGEDP
jgi:amino acid adenylation domain-containing protein/FkbM family methyltransferase